MGSFEGVNYNSNKVCKSGESVKMSNDQKIRMPHVYKYMLKLGLWYC